MMARSTRLALVLVVLTSSGRAMAHDFWLERQAGGFVLRYGHRGAEVLPLDASKLRSLNCRKDKGRPENLLRSAVPAANQLSLNATCMVASAFLDGGFYSLTPDGEKNLPKSKVPDAVKAWRSKQFAKWIDIRSPIAAEAQGDELEIVPVTDLRKAKVGDKATFRILLDGKPVSGAVLSMGHKALGESDDQGEVRVKIRSSDVESVSATFRRPVKSPDADSEVFEASLTFEVAR